MQINTKLILALLILLVVSACAAVDGTYNAHVWEDSNINGVQDEWEKGIEGVTILFVYPKSGEIYWRELTNEDGNAQAFRPGGCGKLDVFIALPKQYDPTTPVLATIDCGVVYFGLAERTK